MLDYDPTDTRSADLFSDGCATHSDPACLCDVDLSRGRCPAPHREWLRRSGYDGGNGYPWVIERLRRPERRWLMEKFAPETFARLARLYSTGQVKDGVEDVSNNTTSASRSEIMQIVLLTYSNVQHETALFEQFEGKVARKTAVNISRQVGMGARTVLHGYTIWLWVRHKERGVSRAALARYITSYLPLSEATVYRWIYDFEKGGRSDRMNARHAELSAAVAASEAA